MRFKKACLAEEAATEQSISGELEIGCFFCNIFQGNIHGLTRIVKKLFLDSYIYLIYT